MNWTEPQSVAEAVHRICSWRALILAVLLLAIGITEARFAVVEKLLGRFLVATNHERPRTGGAWQIQKQAQVARENIAGRLQKKESIQYKSQRTENLTGLVQSLAKGQGVMLDPVQFITLYINTEISKARRIMDPMVLLMLRDQAQWKRLYCEKDNARISFYFLDSENHVIASSNVNAQRLIEQSRSVLANQRIEQLSGQNWRIYSGPRFIQELNQQPISVQHELIPFPQKLLELGGRILRVGIARGDTDGTVEIAFEIENASGSRMVLRQNARQWTVWRIERQLRQSDRSRNAPEPVFGQGLNAQNSSSAGLPGERVMGRP